MVLHEHPVAATSWKMDAMRKILKMEGVSTVVGDQCQFGLKTNGAMGAPAPARKRTRFLSNSNEILRELGKLCPGDHVHQPLVGGRAEKAAAYPEGLCRAICRGLVKQMDQEKGHLKQLMKLSATDVVREVPEDEEDHSHWQSAWDDVSGKELDPSGVKAARALEIKHVNLKHILEKDHESRSQGKRM